MACAKLVAAAVASPSPSASAMAVERATEILAAASLIA